MKFSKRLAHRFSQHYTIGTLQLITLLVSILLLISLLILYAVRQSHQLTEGSLQQAEAHLRQLQIEEELVQWRQFDRIVSALQFLSNGKMNAEDLVQTSRLLHRLARNTSVDPLLLLAVVSVESRGDPLILGRFRSGAESGALGLMQIKLETAQIVARKMGQRVRYHELMRPDVNLLYGTAYLLQMVQRYGSLEKGLIAYNIGPGALESAISDRRHLSKRYYNRVLSNYKGLVSRFGTDRSLEVSLQGEANPKIDAE